MKVAEPTIERMVQYHRLLETLREEGRRVISSRQIGDMLGFKASQVRKDLSYFGEIGRRGVGYNVERLCDHIGGVLSSPKTWKIALAGVGHIGTALLTNKAIRSSRLSFEALFDIDPEKIGHEFAGVHCWDFNEMPNVMRDRSVELLILAVPAREAQKCLDLAASSGTLRGVLALTQGTLTVPDGITIVRVDILAELEKLMFFIKNAPEGAGPE